MKVLIKEQLSTIGLSPYAFAKKYDVAMSTMYAWCNGKLQPSYEDLEMLCGICQCTLDDMLILERQDYWGS